MISCNQNQESVTVSDDPSDGTVLPFPEPPQASVTGKTLKDSKHQWCKAEIHLPEDAPNFVIFMTDDAGFANPSIFGGPINMPTMTRLAESGIAYIMLD
jgi:arylsulfatase